MDVTLRVEFIDHDKDTIYKIVTIKNAALLAADFSIKTEPPFTISHDKYLIKHDKTE